MGTRKKPPMAMRHIRWQEEGWAWVAQIAKTLGLGQSEFIRRATVGAAKAMELGLNPYYVGGANATPHNTRINFSGSEGDIKAAPGGRRAPVRSRSDCGAKDRPDEEIGEPKDENPTGGKV